MNMVHETNAKNLLYAHGSSLKDTAIAADLDDAAPLQGRNASDGQYQNSRSGHHPTCGIKGEKTSSLRTKSLS